jgi:hypothetical protein
MTWDWQVFFTDDGSGRTYLEWMLEAWRWTLAVAACSWVVAMSVGAVVGTLRTLPGRPVVVGVGQRLGGVVSQHPAFGPTFLVVLCGAQNLPGFSASAWLCVGGLCLGLFHLGTHCRAGACRHPSFAQGPALCGHGHGLYHGAVLPLCALAHGLSHHLAAAHQRVDELAEKLVSGFCGVDCRTHHVRHAGARRNLAWH